MIEMRTREFQQGAGMVIAKAIKTGEFVALTRYGKRVALLIPWDMVEKQTEEINSLIVENSG